jgi:REP element-mobilizing transposase RayT
MPAFARHQIVAKGEIGAYHCIARCVRRAFLCGDDPLSGRNFEHRKSWARDRLERLAESFAIDVGAYAVMANHLHVVLKQRPDLACDWSPEEVTLRWRRAFPKTRDEHSDPTELLLKAEAADPKLVAQRRERLADLSWFMRGLCEPIARRANREDACTGRFWEGRFKSVALLDDAAILACSAYVDLNPIRAGLARTPETSSFTSARERIDGLKAAAKSTGRSTRKSLRPSLPGAWLAELAAETPRGKSPKTTPWLSLDPADYLKLLDWSGRQLRSDKRGAIPTHLAPILGHLEIRGDCWLELVRRFGALFKRSAGASDHLRSYADRRNLRFLYGSTFARTAFG